MCKAILQKAFLMLGVLLVFSVGAYAQTALKITGSVSDDSNFPLPGVSIFVKGSTTGTITDLDGQFSLEVPDEQSVLVVSYVGYQTQEITVGNQRVLPIKMSEDSQVLEELVIVGYGTAKKKDLTGAISTMNGEAISERRTSQISQALQGAAPGLMVTRNNSEPGSSADIKVRGVTSIGSTAPLIIVDGIPVNSIDEINPNDIENLSVLKDAASASIYGSRAAAGVILITTKRAKEDVFSVSYNFEYGIETPTTLPEYLDVERYMQVYNEMGWNDGGNGTNQYPTYTKEYIETYRDKNKINPSLYPITDWTGLIMKNYAPRTSHLVTINGGSEKLRTVASIGYDKTDGLYANKDWERYTARINNDLHLNKYVSFNLDASMKRVNNNNAIKDPLYFARIAAPIYHAGWSDGTVGEGKNGANDWALINNGGFNNACNNLISGKFGIDITPIEGLKISGVVAPSFTFDKKKKFEKAVEWYTPLDPTMTGGYLSGANTTSLEEKRNERYNIVSQAFANYTKRISNHSINLLLGMEQSYLYDESLGASRDEYLLTEFPYLDAGTDVLKDNSGSAYEYAYISHFGRVMYSFKDRYLLQANLRRDGSSRFDSKYRWGIFPSFSVGWVVSEESFFNQIKPVSYLKLRGSWGQLGNERIGNYPYQSTVDFYTALFYNGSVITPEQTAALGQYAVQDITWETTETYDIGMDIYFFKDKLRVTADYYHKKTKDMLLTLQIPMYMGFENPSQNAGLMHTNGWDLDIRWSDRIKDFSYSVTFNISDSRSIIDNLSGTEFSSAGKITMQGGEFNEWYGYKSNGLYQTQEQVDNSAKTSNSVQIGDVWFEDISGPDGVPDGVISPEYDRVLLGGSLPRYIFGGNIGLSYKGFSLGIDFSGVGKRLARLSSLMTRPFADNWGNVPAIIEGNYWSYYNTPEQNSKATYPRVSSVSASNNYAVSDFWLINGAYFRLKNITLSYSLPKNILQKMHLQELRFFGYMNDCFTLSHYPKGWDPEVGESSYPITASFALGFSIKY